MYRRPLSLKKKSLDVFEGGGTYVHRLYKDERKPFTVPPIKHILCKVSCFYCSPFIFVGYRNDRFFPPYKSLYFKCYPTIPMLDHAHISYNARYNVMLDSFFINATMIIDKMVYVTPL